MGHEFTVYLIAVMIVGAIGFVVNSMITMHKDTKKKIMSLNKRLHDLEVNGTPDTRTTQPLPKDIFGEIDMKHPHTGEKLRAHAHCRPKWPRDR